MWPNLCGNEIETSLNICNRFEEIIANISHCHYEYQRKKVGLVESISKQHESDKRIWGMG